MSRYLVVRNDPSLAFAARTLLEGISGVIAVSIDAASGSIMITYDGRALSPAAIIQAMTARGCLRVDEGGLPPLIGAARPWTSHLVAALKLPGRGARTRGLL